MSGREMRGVRWERVFDEDHLQLRGGRNEGLERSGLHDVEERFGQAGQTASHSGEEGLRFRQVSRQLLTGDASPGW